MDALELDPTEHRRRLKCNDNNEVQNWSDSTVHVDIILQEASDCIQLLKTIQNVYSYIWTSENIKIYAIPIYS